MALPNPRNKSVICLGPDFPKLRVLPIHEITDLFSTNPRDPLVEKAGLQECLIFAAPDNGSHIVRGPEDPVGLLSQVDPAHRGHVVDVVVPRGGVGVACLLVPDNSL